MCDSFDIDPAWQGWQRWYFGSEEPTDNVLPSNDHCAAEEPERELATVH